MVVPNPIASRSIQLCTHHTDLYGKRCNPTAKRDANRGQPFRNRVYGSTTGRSTFSHHKLHAWVQKRAASSQRNSSNENSMPLVNSKWGEPKEKRSDRKAQKTKRFFKAAFYIVWWMVYDGNLAAKSMNDQMKPIRIDEVMAFICMSSTAAIYTSREIDLLQRWILVLTPTNHYQ